MHRSLLFVLLISSGCADNKMGIAYLRISELSGPCPVSQPLHDYPSTCTGPCGIDDFNDLPFRRAHATASFEGGSRYPGGNLIVLAFRDDDGTIERIYSDLGASRGYGSSAVMQSAPVPASTPVEQALGYVAWRDGKRTFSATKVIGAIDFQAMTKMDPLNRNRTTTYAGAFFGHVAFEGKDDVGQVACRVVGFHAANDHARTEPYDPTWLAPNRGTLIAAGEPPPTFEGDAPPGANLVAPGAAGPDPGGAPPTITFDRPIDLSLGGGAASGCD